MIELTQVPFLNDKLVNTFKKNNITTVEDLLYHYPAKYDDYTIIPLEEATLDKTVTIAGICQSKATVINVKNNLTLMNFYVDIDGSKVRVTIFNRQFLRSKIFYGKYVRLTGKFDGGYTKFVASEISFDEFGTAINPIFNLKGIDDKKVLEIKEKLYEEYKHILIENLPQEVRKRYELISIDEAIHYINIPETTSEIMAAIKRIKFEELLEYQLKVKYMLYMRKHFPEGIAINYNAELVETFINNLPFKLTPDQRTSLDTILKDISSCYKMNRLLQGEVGSGKTIVALISLYAVVTSGYQGAILVPTEVLAFQHYQSFIEYLQDYDVKVVLLTSSTSAKERKEILTNLENGNINIIVGTHSLFQKDVIFNKLGLVITDEEHRFGVRQRVSMVGKGYLIDHLKMSATPIPRTLAISILGDSDISVIKTMPGNKKEVITKFLEYDKRSEVFDHIREELKRGRQIYIITPMIEESDVMDLKNAMDVYENTKNYYKDECEVGLIHGRLKPQEKEEVMHKFMNNEIQILVATSVIEVGVNVINATTIVILDADRFGIAQLHQMRGRVRRSDHQAYCFLISKATAEASLKRLKLVEEVSDGFILAEEDLMARGQGDIFGEKQTGNINFKMADILVDKELFEEANKLADEIMDNKYLFENEEYKNLLTIVHNNYQNKKEILE